METGQLRYLALGLGSALVALGVFLDKLPEEAFVAALVAVFGIAAADQIKHRAE